tara:strand:- start:847 stop:948 length:102 start_codon:yes stop_codon:yes gene_type:complete
MEITGGLVIHVEKVPAVVVSAVVLENAVGKVEE